MKLDSRIINGTETPVVVKGNRDLILEKGDILVTLSSMASSHKATFNFNKNLNSVGFAPKASDVFFTSATDKLVITNDTGAVANSPLIIFLSDLTFDLFWIVWTGSFGINVWVKKTMPTVKKLGGFQSIGSQRYFFDTRQEANVFPSVIWYEGGYGHILKDFLSLKYMYVNIGNNSQTLFKSYLASAYLNLKALNIYVEGGWGMDVKLFFSNNKRQSLILSSVPKFEYSGGAVFPKIINDDIDGVPTVYIISATTHTNNPTINIDTSRFIVDFANKVEAVNGSKVIRIINNPPDTTYEDLSQPLFTNFNSALNFIENTLGVSVQF